MYNNEKQLISNFVESLVGDEPFDGDAVTELSKFFVSCLCNYSGEEDQIQHILQPSLRKSPSDFS